MEENEYQTIYIDSDFRCYSENEVNRTPIQTDFFKDKPHLISKYRFIPFGSSWQRLDGQIFVGEMIAPIEPL